MAIATSFVGLCVLLLVGHLLRMKVRLLQKMYLPSCVIGGLLGLIVIQVCRGMGHPLPEGWTAGWGMLPGFLINIVFACLFLGVALPKLSELGRRAGHQLVYGQIVAWGQYVVGVGLVLMLLAPMVPVPERAADDAPAVEGGEEFDPQERARDMFGGILPVGFEGGHGTAGGLGPTFEKLGWPEGKDFALASATCGIVSAIVVGMTLVNWAARRGYTTRRLSPDDVPEDDAIGVIPVDRRPSAGTLTVSSASIGAFTLHIAIVGVAVLIGVLVWHGLAGLERLIAPNATRRLMTSFPLFPLCMLGGLVVQLFEDRFDRHKLLDVGLTRRIQNAALDFLVVAAIATINLQVIRRGWLPLAILVAAGIAWNVLCVTVLARRILPDAWFERSIAEMGQSMGVTATGLLLLRVVDPDYETPAADAFACKQIVHEPFMGGGLWTSAAIPLLAWWGGWPVFFITVGAMAMWLGIAFVPRLLARRA